MIGSLTDGRNLQLTVLNFDLFFRKKHYKNIIILIVICFRRRRWQP